MRQFHAAQITRICTQRELRSLLAQEAVYIPFSGGLAKILGVFAACFGYLSSCNYQIINIVTRETNRLTLSHLPPSDALSIIYPLIDNQGETASKKLKAAQHRTSKEMKNPDLHKDKTQLRIHKIISRNDALMISHQFMGWNSKVEAILRKHTRAPHREWQLLFLEYNQYKSLVNSYMPKTPPEEGKLQKKNQKNIYVQKINKISSLMRISQDNLYDQEKQLTLALPKKKIKKTHSQVDKIALKLEKNRESAKRARLRKKWYVKLLQSEVEALKAVSQRGQQIQKQSVRYLSMLDRRLQKQKHSVLDEVDRYLSRQDLGELKDGQAPRPPAGSKMDRFIEQICQMVMCTPLRNIRQLVNQGGRSIQNIAQNSGDKALIGNIIGQIMREGEQIRQLFQGVIRQNEKVKKAIQQQNEERNRMQSHQDEFGYFHPQIKIEGNVLTNVQLMGYGLHPNESNGIYININEAERMLTKMTAFLQSTQEKPESIQ